MSPLSLVYQTYVLFRRRNFPIYWKWIETENKDIGKEEKVPLLRYYRVFNIKQCEGIGSKRQEEATYEHDLIEEADNNYKRVYKFSQL